MKHDYPSIICDYCGYTDYGVRSAVGDTPYNMCEGTWCQEAYDLYKEENPDDDRELEEMF